MMTPTVSVCLPNLNNRRFLAERLDTIRQQTLSDWELVISDNYSDDGAWEFLAAAASADSRMKAFQTPRGGGMYPNWNTCIREATGEFVYVATSDDTMAPDCLEKLVAALRAHPECDIAHCQLRAIDVEGRDRPVEWYEWHPFLQSSKKLAGRDHIRVAPFDGMLHLTGLNVYISITQLLIRRSLFDRVGLFESKWGSMGDFEWEMRASLVASTVHVADTWGGWRIHPAQATAKIPPPREHRARCEEMMDHAIAASWSHIAPQFQQYLKSWRRGYLRQRAEWWLGSDRSARGRLAFLIRGLLSGRRSEWDVVGAKLGLPTRASRNESEIIAAWCDECGLLEPLLPIGVST